MDEKLEKWIAECVKNGTFVDRDGAVEFCVGGVKFLAESMGLNQKKMIELASASADKLSLPKDMNSESLEKLFPLVWKDSMSEVMPFLDGESPVDRIIQMAFSLNKLKKDPEAPAQE